jgi:TPR repeat protein
MRRFVHFLLFSIAIGCAFGAAEPTLDELKAKALAGDSKSQLWLGSKYDRGSGVRQNYKEAAKWYEMAAN